MSLSKVAAAKMLKRTYYGRQSLRERQLSKRGHHSSLRRNQKSPSSINLPKEKPTIVILYER